MPTLSEKLAEFEKIKVEFDAALQDLKERNESEIQSAVELATENKATEIQNTLKNEISRELNANLNEKSDYIHTALKEFAKDEASKNAVAMLNDEAFLQRFDELTLSVVENKVDEKLNRLDMLNLQFKNATSCFKICLVNELYMLSEVLKQIAQVEIYENNIKNNVPVFKAYKVI